MFPQDSCCVGGDTINQQQLGHFGAWIRGGHNWLPQDFLVLTREGRIINWSLPVTRVTTSIQIPSDLPSKATAMCFEALEGRTQPSTTYDSTKSPGARQLGTIVVKEYKLGRWKRKKGGMVMVWGWRQIRRSGGIEELTVMDTWV